MWHGEGKFGALLRGADNPATSEEVFASISALIARRCAEGLSRGAHQDAWAVR